MASNIQQKITRIAHGVGETHISSQAGHPAIGLDATDVEAQQRGWNNEVVEIPNPASNVDIREALEKPLVYEDPDNNQEPRVVPDPWIQDSATDRNLVHERYAEFTTPDGNKKVYSVGKITETSKGIIPTNKEGQLNSAGLEEELDLLNRLQENDDSKILPPGIRMQTSVTRDGNKVKATIEFTTGTDSPDPDDHKSIIISHYASTDRRETYVLLEDPTEAAKAGGELSKIFDSINGASEDFPHLKKMFGIDTPRVSTLFGADRARHQNAVREVALRMSVLRPTHLVTLRRELQSAARELRTRAELVQGGVEHMQGRYEENLARIEELTLRLTESQTLNQQLSVENEERDTTIQSLKEQIRNLRESLDQDGTDGVEEAEQTPLTDALARIDTLTDEIAQITRERDRVRDEMRVLVESAKTRVQSGEPVKLSKRSLTRAIKKVSEDPELLASFGIDPSKSSAEDVTLLILLAAVEASNAEIDPRSKSALANEVRRLIGRTEKARVEEQTQVEEATSTTEDLSQTFESIAQMHSANTDALASIQDQLNQLIGEITPGDTQTHNDLRQIIEQLATIQNNEPLEQFKIEVESKFAGILSGQEDLKGLIGAFLESQQQQENLQANSDIPEKDLTAEPLSNEGDTDQTLTPDDPTVSGVNITINQTITGGTPTAPTPHPATINQVVGGGPQVAPGYVIYSVPQGIYPQVVEQVVIPAATRVVHRVEPGVVHGQYGNQSTAVAEAIYQYQSGQIPANELARRIAQAQTDASASDDKIAQKAFEEAKEEYSKAVTAAINDGFKQFSDALATQNEQIAQLEARLAEAASTAPDTATQERITVLEERIAELTRQLQEGLTREAQAQVVVDHAEPSAEMTVEQRRAALANLEAELNEANEAASTVELIDTILGGDFAEFLAEAGIDITTMETYIQLRGGIDTLLSQIKGELFNAEGQPDSTKAKNWGRLLTLRAILDKVQEKGYLTEPGYENSAAWLKGTIGRLSVEEVEALLVTEQIVEGPTATQRTRFQFSEISQLKDAINEVSRRFNINKQTTTYGVFIASITERRANLAQLANSIPGLQQRIDNLRQNLGESTSSAQATTIEETAQATSETTADNASTEQAAEATEDARAELREAQVHNNIATLEATLNEARKSLEVKREKVKGWKRVVRAVAEVATGILGGTVGRAVIGGVITAGVVGAGIATGGIAGIALAGVTGAVGGGLATGIFSTLVHYKVFHKGKHQIFAEHSMSGGGPLFFFRNKGHEKVAYDTYKLDQRLTSLGQLFNKLNRLDLSNPSAYTLESLNANGINTDEITDAYKQLLYLKELTQYQNLNQIKLQDGFELDGAENIQEALNRLTVQIPAIIESNDRVFDLKPLVDEVAQEVEQDYQKAFRQITLLKMGKGALIGGVSGALLQVVENLQDSGNILGNTGNTGGTASSGQGSLAGKPTQSATGLDAASADLESTARSVEATQNQALADISQQTGIPEADLAAFAGSDGMFNQSELAKLTEYVEQNARGVVDSLNIPANAETVAISDLPEAWQEGLRRMGVNGGTLHLGDSGGTWGVAQGEAIKALTDAGYDISGPEGFNAWVRLSGTIAGGYGGDATSTAAQYNLPQFTGTGTPDVMSALTRQFTALNHASAQYDAAQKAFAEAAKTADQQLASFYSSGVGGHTSPVTNQVAAVGGFSSSGATNSGASDLIGNIGDRTGEALSSVSEGPGALGKGITEGAENLWDNRGTIWANAEKAFKDAYQNLGDFLTSEEMVENIVNPTGHWLVGSVAIGTPILLADEFFGGETYESGLTPQVRLAGETVNVRVPQGGQTQTNNNNDRSDDSSTSSPSNDDNSGGGNAGASTSGNQASGTGRSGQVQHATNLGMAIASGDQELMDRSFGTWGEDVLGTETSTIPGTAIRLKEIAGKMTPYRRFNAGMSADRKKIVEASLSGIQRFVAQGFDGEQGIEIGGQRYRLSGEFQENMMTGVRDRLQKNLRRMIDKAIAPSADTLITATLYDLRDVKMIRDSKIFGRNAIAQLFNRGKTPQVSYETLFDFMRATALLSDNRINEAQKQQFISGYMRGIRKNVGKPRFGGAFRVLPDRLQNHDPEVALATIVAASRAAGYDPAVDADGNITLKSSRRRVLNWQNRNMDKALKSLEEDGFKLNKERRQVEVLARIVAAADDVRNNKGKFPQEGPEVQTGNQAMREAADTQIPTIQSVQV